MKIPGYVSSILVFLVSFLVKEYKIEKGNFVIWDEAHFGKFSQKYLNREFYFDVHPPLGKILTAFSGLIFGQNEDFKFSSKEKFPEKFDYVGMRRFHALIASTVPVFSFNILRIFGVSVKKSLLLSMLCIFENGMTSISRLILLDSHLLAFTALTVFLMLRLWRASRKETKLTEYTEFNNHHANIKQDKNFPNFTNEKKTKWKSSKTHGNPLEDVHSDIFRNDILDLSSKKDPSVSRRKSLKGLFKSENRCLLLLGISLGCVLSIKWIGCLTMLFVGIYIIYDLFSQLLSLPLTDFFRYFMRRVLYLIILPFTIYVSLFYIHFALVCHSGPDDNFMSTSFQLRLINNPFAKTRKYISYGKMITIKSSQGGYLHSHNHEYPKDSNVDSLNEEEGKSIERNTNQANEGADLQVTIYGARDQNNNFYFQKVTDDGETKFVKEGDRIVLLHNETKGYIGCDEKAAFISEGKRAVSRPGMPESGAVWIVELVNGDKEHLVALTGRFYLRNEETGLYLSSSDKSYPSWGYNQGEVFCSSEKSAESQWQIEENFHTDHEDNPLYSEGRQGFWKSFIEHNILMFRTNKSFSQDPDLEPDRIVSSPIEWFFLTRGLRMSQWGSDNRKFYMFMNPLLHYLSGLSIIFAPILHFIRSVRFKRKEKRILAHLEKIEEFQVLSEKSNHNHDTLSSYDRKTLFNLKRESNSLDTDRAFVFTAVGGWFIHYAAFFMVGRVLYLHHYFPALFFAILSLSYCLKSLKTRNILLFTLVVVAVYILYSPLTYGYISRKDVSFLKVIPTWDFID